MTIVLLNILLLKSYPLKSYPLKSYLLKSYLLKSVPRKFILTIAASGLMSCICTPLQATGSASGPSLKASSLKQPVAEQQPLPADVTRLSFHEFFKMPIGPQGLEITEKLQKLHNKKVHIVGYMVHEDDPTPGIFMVAARAVNVGEKADGMADDLPANTLFVHMPVSDANKILTYHPAPWALTGTLQVGNQEETNGRVSTVRLILQHAETQKPSIAFIHNNKP